MSIDVSKMSKGRVALIAVIIWLTSAAAIWSYIPAVVANDLYMSFPEQSDLITAILSWPSLVTAAVSILAGFVLNRVSTKIVLIIGEILVLVGVTGGMGDGVLWCTICCFIMGAGAGMANTAGMALLTEVFLDEDKRARQMGFYNGVMSIAGAMFSFVGGIFALQGWGQAFNVYWIFLPILILVILFIPNIKPSTETVQDVQETMATSGGEKKSLGARYWIFYVIVLFYFLSDSAFMAFNSVFIGENAIGDVALTGTIVSINTLSSLAACLLFGFMFSKLRRKVTLLGFALIAGGYALIVGFPCVATQIVGALMIGFTYGIFFTLLYAYAFAVTPPERGGLVSGLCTCNWSIGIWAGVYLISFFMGIFGGINYAYLAAMVIAIVGFVWEIFNCRKDDRDGILMEPSTE